MQLRARPRSASPRSAPSSSAHGTGHLFPAYRNSLDTPTSDRGGNLDVSRMIRGPTKEEQVHHGGSDPAAQPQPLPQPGFATKQPNRRPDLALLVTFPTSTPGGAGCACSSPACTYDVNANQPASPSADNSAGRGGITVCYTKRKAGVQAQAWSKVLLYLPRGVQP
jgi:hypothetical protein